MALGPTPFHIYLSDDENDNVADDTTWTTPRESVEPVVPEVITENIQNGTCPYIAPTVGSFQQTSAMEPSKTLNIVSTVFSSPGNDGDKPNVNVTNLSSNVAKSGSSFPNSKETDDLKSITDKFNGMTILEDPELLENCPTNQLKKASTDRGPEKDLSKTNYPTSCDWVQQLISTYQTTNLPESIGNGPSYDLGNTNSVQDTFKSGDTAIYHRDHDANNILGNTGGTCIVEKELIPFHSLDTNNSQTAPYYNIIPDAAISTIDIENISHHPVSEVAGSVPTNGGSTLDTVEPYPAFLEQSSNMYTDSVISQNPTCSLEDLPVFVPRSLVNDTGHLPYEGGSSDLSNVTRQAAASHTDLPNKPQCQLFQKALLHPDLIAWLQGVQQPTPGAMFLPSGSMLPEPEILENTITPGDGTSTADNLVVPDWCAAEESSAGDEMLGVAQQMANQLPTVYVSPTGLITVLLRHEVAVEMTLDRAIRVVNHRHQSVAATNNRGNSSCIYHACAKLYQEGTTTDVEVFWGRRAKFTTHGVRFAHGDICYNLDLKGRLLPMRFRADYFCDMSKDMSVNLLYSSSSYGPQLIEECNKAAQASSYVFHKDGAASIYIMGLRIQQLHGGDVIVTCGPKQLRVSPIYGSMYVRTQFVEMAVEMNWNIKVRRGDHRLHASFNGFQLTDGVQDYGIDHNRQAFIRPHHERWETLISNDKVNNKAAKVEGNKKAGAIVDGVSELEREQWCTVTGESRPILGTTQSTHSVVDTRHGRRSGGSQRTRAMRRRLGREFYNTSYRQKQTALRQSWDVKATTTNALRQTVSEGFTPTRLI